MTPTHQQITDTILLAMQRRLGELRVSCQQRHGRRLAEQPIEQLRESPLGVIWPLSPTTWKEISARP